MKCLKKLLLSFLLLLICIFLLIPLNNSFAYSDNLDDYPKPDASIIGNHLYVIHIQNGRPKLSVFTDTILGVDKLYSVYSNKYRSHYFSTVPEDDNINIAVSYYNLNDDSSSWISDGSWHDCHHDQVSGDHIIYCNTDVFNIDGSIFFSGPSKTINPYIVNSLESLSSWKFDNLLVDYGDYDINKTIYLHICKKTVDISGVNSFYYTDSVIALSANGKYYETYEDGQVYYFSIPKDNLPFTVSSGDKIIFYLSSSANNLGGVYSSDEPLKDSSIFDTKSFTVGSSYTDEDKQKDYQDKISSSLEDQKQAIEENTKTNKNIFEKIGDILSYINPFSENFFGKKLVELILDGLKGLFVPEDGFFDTYFSDLKDWFSDRLGFLWTPFDIIIEILNKILNINFSEPIFHIPEINEPFSGSKLISEYDYNLNSLLDNDIFKNIHDIYFIGVDAVIIFALINLARRKIEEVFSN